MVQAASKEALANEGKETDWKGALRVINDTIKAKKDKVSSINGEISAKYDILEKDGVNKKGARMFMSLDALEESERRDVLRTLEKLGAVAGWDKSSDLVDQAETKGDGNVVEMPKPKGKGDVGDPPAEMDGNTKIDPASWKSAFVDHVMEESNMERQDAYVLANTVFDSMTSEERADLTHTTAVKKADSEMATWPE